MKNFFVNEFDKQRMCGENRDTLTFAAFSLEQLNVSQLFFQLFYAGFMVKVRVCASYFYGNVEENVLCLM